MTKRSDKLTLAPPRRDSHFKLYTCFLIALIIIVSVWTGFKYFKAGTQEHKDKTSKEIRVSVNGPEASSRPSFQQTDAKTDAPLYEYFPEYGELPRSLIDTRVDGDLAIDADGRLIISLDIMQMFDYFLSAAGEEPMETIIGRIEEHIREMVPPDAAKEALNILNSYLLYKQGLYALENQYPVHTFDGNLTAPNIVQIKDVLEQRREIRRRYMQPEVVDAFFGEEEMYEQFTMGRLEIQTNNDLTTDEKVTAIEQLEQEFPDDITEDSRKAAEYQAMIREIDILKKQGGNAEEIYELRQNVFGEDAADRLVRLDEKRAIWQSRIDTYVKSRQEVMNAPELSEEEKQQHSEELRQKSFTDRELVRVDAILRIR
jgi:lipase chaperone LimK